jgi:hypothetical protein
VFIWSHGIRTALGAEQLNKALNHTAFAYPACVCSTGICTFDPGFGSTAACESSITFIDGNKGVLLYRG